MNEISRRLIFQINEKTKDFPIIYFARDAERALGLENLLENYYIVCIEKSYITSQLERLYPNKIFCAESKGLQLDNKSTLDLVNHPEVEAWIKKVAKQNRFYAQLFQFNKPTYLKLQNLGGVILNNTSDLNRLFEDKISQFKLLSSININLPKSEILNITELNFAELTQKFGNKFVIQLDRAHTGLGTFIIESEGEFINFKAVYNGNTVKISKFISGEPYTINASITKKGIIIQGLQYQITGYHELTSGKGSTVGNDWSYANSLEEELKSRIYENVKSIGELMKSYGYIGIFGVDLIIKDNSVYIIEVNARQTANISLQTKLELKAYQTPLILTHLAEFLELDFDINQESGPKIPPLEGSQIFLRAKYDNFKINTQLNSGIYRLQSDNSAINWSFDKLMMKFTGVKEKVIFIDEDKDKPLVWQNEGYSIDQIKHGGFVLIIQNRNSVKNQFEEVARMQFTNQIVYNNKVNGWILEALVNIENLIK